MVKLLNIRLFIFLLAGFGVASQGQAFGGLHFGAKREKDKPTNDAQALSEGYTLLNNLLGDEKNVSKILLIKKEDSDFKRLIKDISKTTGDAHKQIETLLGKNGAIRTDLKPLPAIEQATRDSIGKERAKQLLKEKGNTFQLDLLLTQVEALGYGTHLARTLAVSDPDTARQSFLSQLAGNLDALRERTLSFIRFAEK